MCTSWSMDAILRHVSRARDSAPFFLRPIFHAYTHISTMSNPTPPTMRYTNNRVLGAVGIAVAAGALAYAYRAPATKAEGFKGSALL